MAKKLPGKSKKTATKAAAAVATAAAAAGAAKVVASVKKRTARKDQPCKGTPSYMRPVEVTITYRSKGAEVIVRLDPKEVDAVVWNKQALKELADAREVPLKKQCPPNRPKGITVLKSGVMDTEDGARSKPSMMRLASNEDFGGCYWINGQLICWGERMQ